MESQKDVWNKIAPEWYEFKDEPGRGIMDFLEKQKGCILDLGAGTGRHLIKIKNGKMWLVDFSEEMLKYARKKAKENKIEAEFTLADSTNLPFKNNFFDSGVCVALLHCIETKEKREKTIKELFRVLKPNAKVKIAVWNKNSKRFKNSKKERFVNWRDKGSRYYYLYEPEEIYKEFEKVGFKIIEKFPLNLNIAFIAQKPKI
jgi:tRNA (uracil-5-)-methyltransferase TRM9